MSERSRLRLVVLQVLVLSLLATLLGRLWFVQVVASENYQTAAAVNGTREIITPAPRGMMKDCPLVVNGTAATSKSSGQVSDPGRVPVATLPVIETNIDQAKVSLVKSFLPNRGPTHLRCCVFLI